MLWNTSALASADCNGTLPVTAEIAAYLKTQGFAGFSPNTHFIGMPHLMPDVVDWLSALIELGISPANIHLLSKQYSQVAATRQRLGDMGLDITDYTPAPIGKYYETLSERDLPRFWAHCIAQVEASITSSGPQNVIVMDDGGRVLRSIPAEFAANPNIRITGVEQTTNGFDLIRAEGHSIDIVIPSMSALKLEFEPPFIAYAAIHKLRDKLGIFRNRDVAVIGIGHIGASLVQVLLDNHNSVFVYDKTVSVVDGKLVDPKNLIPADINVYEAPSAATTKSHASMIRAGHPPSSSNIYICNSLEQAVQSCNYVFGCTGRDIFQGINLDEFIFHGENKKLDETRFISVSSGDKEYQSLLQWMAGKPGIQHHGAQLKAGSRWDVTLDHGGSLLRVAQQGFPINFDGQTCSGTPEEMQLISSFLLGAIVQAYEYGRQFPVQLMDEEKHLIMLSPVVQRRILETWLEQVPTVRDLYKEERLQQILNDPDWFAKRSEGLFCPVFQDDLPSPECLAHRSVLPPPNKVRRA